MLLVLDLLANTPRARVAGDFGIAIEHTNDGLGRDDRERLSDQGVGNRVVVLVEAQVGGFA